MEEKKTLRDEFAMAAMQAYLSNTGMLFTSIQNRSEASIKCYEWADAMLNQRTKQ